MSFPNWITSPDDPRLDELCNQLAALSPQLEQSGAWPAEQLAICGRYGVYAWFLPERWGGLGWSDADLLRGYLRLSHACLTTAFIITQRMGACTRIAAAENSFPAQQTLAKLISGELFATVAISHLTTSRRHLAEPVLKATETPDGFVLRGYSPWVTGAKYAQWVLTGAAFADGRQLMIALPMDSAGVDVHSPESLVGLSASHTGRMQLHDVHVDRSWCLASPADNVMKLGVGTGGLQTSALALGLASAAISYLENEQQKRPEVASPTQALRAEWQGLVDDLLSIAGGTAACSNEQLRTNANSMALRSAQAALAVAKGTGYVVGHPAGRWCREALFFLVWSCPQGVVAANLCELAGIE